MISSTKDFSIGSPINDDRLTPVFSTHAARAPFPTLPCTETRSSNQCRVGGWSRSFWTIGGQDALATALDRLWTSQLGRKPQGPPVERGEGDRAGREATGRVAEARQDAGGRDGLCPTGCRGGARGFHRLSRPSAHALPRLGPAGAPPGPAWTPPRSRPRDA